MQESSYITRSDLDTALAQFRDETATLVADVVAKQLQNLGGGNGSPAAAQPVRARTLETDAAQILDGIVSLKAEVASNRRETRELKANINGLGKDIDGLRKEVKADVEGLRKEVKADIDGLRREVKDDIDGFRKEVKDDIDGFRKEVKADIDGLRKEIKADVGDLRQNVKLDVDSLKHDMSELREMRGEVRIVKWMFGLVVAALIAGLTIVHQDLGRRIDGVTAELRSR